MIDIEVNPDYAVLRPQRGAARRRVVKRDECLPVASVPVQAPCQSNVRVQRLSQRGMGSWLNVTSSMTSYFRSPLLRRQSGTRTLSW
jgi:hypothetical protein